MGDYHPSHRPGSRPTFASLPDRTVDVGFVHVGKPVSQRRMEGVWECADNCPHPDHESQAGDVEQTGGPESEADRGR